MTKGIDLYKKILLYKQSFDTFVGQLRFFVLTNKTSISGMFYKFTKETMFPT